MVGIDKYKMGLLEVKVCFCFAAKERATVDFTLYVDVACCFGLFLHWSLVGVNNLTVSHG